LQALTWKARADRSTRLDRYVEKELVTPWAARRSLTPIMDVPMICQMAVMALSTMNTGVVSAAADADWVMLTGLDQFGLSVKKSWSREGEIGSLSEVSEEGNLEGGDECVGSLWKSLRYYTKVLRATT
jgi:hypothetical protein